MADSQSIETRRKLTVNVRNVTKTFGAGESRVFALKEANFDAREGEMLLIVGPSGCGKTTLLSVIAGTLKFDSGEIDVFDCSLSALNAAQITEFRRKYIGFIFLQFHLIPTLSCVENVSVPLLINGVNRRVAEEKAFGLLRQVGMDNKARERPGNLSGGQQQRIAIARALVHDPRMLICDEPTSALDRENGAKTMEILCTVARQPGRTVVVVTHDNRIFQYADRMAEMEDGRVQRVHENPSHFKTGLP